MNRCLSIFVMLTLFFCACGGAHPQTQPPAYHPPPVANHTSHYQMEAIELSGAMVEADSEQLAAKSTTKAPAEAGPGVAAQPQDRSVEQKLIKNGQMTVQVRSEDDIEPAVGQVEHIAATLDGYVSHQTTSSITLRIPTGRLDEAITAVSALGKVTQREITVSDVTANYVDLQIRIENLRRVRKRLQELVEQGQNVQEILEVEKELTRVTTQLESLEGQMRVLQNRIAYATLYVRFEERVMPGPLGWVFYGGYHAVKWLFVWD